MEEVLNRKKKVRMLRIQINALLLLIMVLIALIFTGIKANELKQNFMASPASTAYSADNLITNLQQYEGVPIYETAFDSFYETAVPYNSVFYQMVIAKDGTKYIENTDLAKVSFYDQEEQEDTTRYINLSEFFTQEEIITLRSTTHLLSIPITSRGYVDDVYLYPTAITFPCPTAPDLSAPFTSGNNLDLRKF